MVDLKCQNLPLMKKTLRIHAMSDNVPYQVPLAENPLLESIVGDKKIMHGAGICVQNIKESRFRFWLMISG